VPYQTTRRSRMMSGKEAGLLDYLPLDPQFLT
jgi:hypothetical protein